MSIVTVLLLDNSCVRPRTHAQKQADTHTVTVYQLSYHPPSSSVFYEEVEVCTYLVHYMASLPIE